MKSIVFYTIFLILLSIQAYGQIGLKVALGLSDIAFRDDGQTPYLGYEVNSLTHRIPLVTYQFGFYKQWPLSDRYSLINELLLAKKGLSYNTDYLYEDLEYQLHLTYLEVPLLLKYRTAIGKGRQSGIIFGPYVAYLLKDRLNSSTQTSSDNLYGTVKKFDFGIALGYQSDFRIGSQSLFWDIRGSYGLINMMEQIDNAVLSYENPDNQYARNVTFMLSVGYFLWSGAKNEEP